MYISRNTLYFLRFYFSIFLLILTLLLFGRCENFDSENNSEDWVTRCVTATAYNSVHYQTLHNPKITAWGDTLKPGMKAIAVSRDLIKLGLTYNSKVKIEGFEGVYLVKDKMHYRWRDRIDIYMGEDIKKAKKFGRKKVNLSYIFKKVPASQ